MGKGYWILVWDGFGCGLNMVNPRLHHESGDNWWPCDDDATVEEIAARHKLVDLYDSNWKVILE